MSRRTRLAALISGVVMVVATLVVALAVALSWWTADEPADGAVTTQAGVVRMPNGDAVLVLAAEGPPAGDASAWDDALPWLLVALGCALVPAAAAGWVLSKRLLRPVDEAMAEMAERDHVRRRQLDDVIHELRTPLAIAGTNIELASSDASLDGETRGLIDAASRATNRMRRVVDDLAEHGHLSIAPAGEFDLAAEVRAVAGEHVGPARARGVSVVVAGASSTPVPYGDATAVRTALGNLAGNAVRLAPGGSTITFSCGVCGDWAWAAVSDEGPGLAEHVHPSVFERGWSGRQDRDRGDHHRGLGLTIARQFTEANGGVITIDSEEGLGSTFTVWLPLADVALEADILDVDRIHPAARPWHTLLPSRIPT